MSEGVWQAGWGLGQQQREEARHEGHDGPQSYLSEDIKVGARPQLLAGRKVALVSPSSCILLDLGVFFDRLPRYRTLRTVLNLYSYRYTGMKWYRNTHYVAHTHTHTGTTHKHTLVLTKALTTSKEGKICPSVAME